MPELRDEERRIAKGLVCVRLARVFVTAARDEETPPTPFGGGADHRYLAQLRTQAVRNYRRGIEYAPMLGNAHRELADLYCEMEEPEQALSVYEKLLEQFPDDYEALCWLASHHLENDCPQDSEPYVVAAARLRPRERKTQILRWNQRLGAVRHATRKRKFDVARRELEAATAEQPPETPAHWLPLVRATIEYKAKNVEEAERFVEEAKTHLSEPTPIWLLMHANAVRYNLDRELKNEFSARFKAAVTRACTSQTAAEMAYYLSTFLSNKITYTGFATHQPRSASTWSDAHVSPGGRKISRVLMYMKLDEKWRLRGESLMRELSKTGRLQFPQDPHFPLFAGLAAMGSSPFFCDAGQAMRLLEQALELDKASPAHLSPELLELARHSLALVESYRHSGLSRLLFAADDEDDDEDDDDYEDDDYDDYEDDEDYDEDDEDEGSPEAFFGRGPNAGSFPYQHLQNIVPGFILEFLEQKAAAQGVDFQKLMAEIAQGDLEPEEALARLTGAPAPAKSAKRR